MSKRGLDMKFIELAKKRYSCRNFSTKKVEQFQIMEILEAAYVAPTAANRQPHRLLVVQEVEGLAKVAKAGNIYNAPLAIIVCGETKKAWVRPFDKKNATDIDTSIITSHMMLQATDIGLNSLWGCYFDPEFIKLEFNIPDSFDVVSILALGHSLGEPASSARHSTVRNPLDSFVFYDSMSG